MNERVKELRQTLNLTLEKFGTRLGVTRTAIYNIEAGNRKLTDQMFLAICREYNVNPNWLEDGSGPMFLERSEDDEYMEAAMKLSDDPLVISVLIEYAKLQPEDRAIVRQYIDNIIKRYKEGP